MLVPLVKRHNLCIHDSLQAGCELIIVKDLIVFDG